MSTAQDIEAEFRPKSKRGYGIIMLSADDACAMIRRAQREKVRVLGIDAFLIRGETVQPFMEHSNDYSTRGYYLDSDWDDAVAFIGSKMPLGFVFEVVLDKGILSGPQPNQSSEPTLSSVTPPAGQESRPR